MTWRDDKIVDMDPAEGKTSLFHFETRRPFSISTIGRDALFLRNTQNKYHPDPLYFPRRAQGKRLARLDSHVEYMSMSSKLQLSKSHLALKRSFDHASRLL
jgi:hypothetical protein